MAFLAVGRVRAVGLALAVELAALVPLGQIPSMPDGIAAALVAALAGTVAVVNGPLGGVVVALAGATAFGFVDDWGTGELAALAVWPGVVLAAGLFGAALQRERIALGQAVAAHESERQRLALELHDETAQQLAGALIQLRKVTQGTDPGVVESAAIAHDLIEETIRAVRGLAVELRPKVLDDFGLLAAVQGLAADLSVRGQAHVTVSDRGVGTARMPAEIELVLYRVVQQALAVFCGSGAHDVHVVLERGAGKASVEIEGDDAADALQAAAELSGLHDRIRLVDGRLVVSSGPELRTIVRAEIPLSRHGLQLGRGRRLPGA